jgi:peptidoglycan/xylan/chitin deacetylase (PgdA/CDA1 family)
VALEYSGDHAACSANGIPRARGPAVVDQRRVIVTLTYALRRALVEMVRMPWAHSALRPLLRDRVAIIMMHRFADAERGIVGHDPAALRKALASLRSNRVPLLSLNELCTALESHEPVEGVVFTVDDGYDDFATVAAPVFGEFDCPVTVFLATGFLDGLYWNWWDKLEAVLRDAAVLPNEVRVGRGTVVHLNSVDRLSVLPQLVTILKRLPERERHEEVMRLADELGVHLPDAAPGDRAPLAWDVVRQLAARGVEFGPHTVSHAHLTPLPREEVLWELSTSFQRLREEVEAPLPVFCYPYGLPSDLTDTVTDVCQEIGLKAALTAVPDYLETRDGAAVDMYRLPRFAFPTKLVDFHQIVSGFERLKRLVRRSLT